ncbi:MAG: glycosyltransferase family 2 protein [Planctomycetes bacterium]|nr:glycosyltransferase family 2 protein [Planctomycetota bacterium]
MAKPTSIIIPVFNEADYTRLCLESLARTTDVAQVDVIVIDNGSSDHSADVLASFPFVRVIANEENKGFAIAVNQGIRAANPESDVVVLNNDTVLTDGWLTSLRDVAKRENAGAVGPVTNSCGGSQKIECPRITLATIDEFARERRREFAGRCYETDLLIAFCVLFTNRAIRIAGGFDERFELGNFEDNDICRRLRGAGEKLVVAEDVFIFHFGSRSFIGNRIDGLALFEMNRARFEEKWNEKIPAPGEAEVALQKVRQLLAWADDAESKKDFSGAEKYRLGAIELSGGSAELILALAKGYARAAWWRKARDVLEQLTEFDPGNSEVSNLLALARRNLEL